MPDKLLKLLEIVILDSFVLFPLYPRARSLIKALKIVKDTYETNLEAKLKEDIENSPSAKTSGTKRKVAAALGFNPDTDNAPRILAAGQGELAEDILSIARANGTPVIEDPALSEVLHSLPRGAEVPENLHRAVAAIFALVYRANTQSGSLSGTVDL